MSQSHLEKGPFVGESAAVCGVYRRLLEWVLGYMIDIQNKESEEIMLVFRSLTISVEGHLTLGCSTQLRC